MIAANNARSQSESPLSDASRGSKENEVVIQPIKEVRLR